MNNRYWQSAETKATEKCKQELQESMCKEKSAKNKTKHSFHHGTAPLHVR